MQFEPIDLNAESGYKVPQLRLPDGQYNFRVKSAKETLSKAGNNYIRLCLSILDRDGDYIVWDTLMPTMKHKFKQFLKHMNLKEQASAGEISEEDVINLTGRCLISTEESDGYPPKNVVLDYLPSDIKKENKSSNKVKENKEIKDYFNDDIPF